jgi:hypothetical protein
LSDAKKEFFKLRKIRRIQVCEEHVIDDHPERGYTVDEVVNLVLGFGTFEDTNDPRYIGDRFYWRTKDLSENLMRLVIEFDEDEVGNLIFVVSAGERI